MIKKISLMAFFVFTMVLMTNIANAHVTLNPDKSEPGAYEKHVVRVPVEKDTNTTKVELVVPDGLQLVAVAPVDGFKHKFTKDSKGNITKVTWNATGEGIGPNEFIDFPIQVANSEEEGQYKWKAYQTYEDGETVKWTGGKDAEKPAPVTTVSANTAQEQGESKDEEQQNTTLLWIVAIIAIILSLIAIFKKTKK